MGTKVRIAGAVVLALALGVIGFLLGSTHGNGRDARFAFAISRMTGVNDVGLSGTEVARVSFDRDASVDEILAVRDRLDERDLDPSIDVWGVHGRWSELETVAPTMVAVAQTFSRATSVRVREVGDNIWVEAGMADDGAPEEGARTVLRILREFAEEGLPEGVGVVGANTPGEQLDLVFVTPEALRDVEATVASLAAVVEAGPTAKVECDAAGCDVAPFKADDDG